MGYKRIYEDITPFHKHSHQYKVTHYSAPHCPAKTKSRHPDRLQGKHRLEQMCLQLVLAEGVLGE